MKRFISLVLCALMLVSALASCAPAKSDSQSSSADETAKYTAYLEEHLESTPERKPASLVIETAENSEAYGVDMTEFSDDGYLTRAEYGEVVILGKTGAGLDRAVRDYVKNGNPDDYFTVYGEGYRVKKLTIAGNDISEYAVIRDDGADECNTFASSELVSYIEKTCGAVLPEYTASEYAAASDKPQRTITLTVDYPALGDEAFRIEIGADGNLTVAGGRYRGCMYGVYDLLEDIGWRFVGDSVGIVWGNKDSSIEYLYEADHIDLTAALNRTESPAIAFRQIYDADTLTQNINNLGVKNKMNSIWANTSKYGSYGLTGVACHGLQGHHSEIFTDDVYEGMDVSGKQPCFTDEAVLECIDAYTVRYVETRLVAGQQIGREIVTVDLAQWDSGETEFCTCKNCLKVFKEEGCTMGAVLRMGNRAAQLLTDNNYGGVNISLLAYSGTNKPPKKTEPLDNVRISYCIYVGSGHIACSNHPVSGVDCDPESGYSNTVYAAELNGWAAICHNKNLDVWYYPMNAYSYAFPSPYFDSLYEDLIYFSEIGVNGIMMLCNREDGAHLDSLAVWLGSMLAWDLSVTKDEYYAAIEEWFNIVYGGAGENMYEYMRMCEYAANMTGCWCAFHSSNTEKVDNEFMAEKFDYMYGLFEEAKVLADTAHQEELVERYESGMLYLCIGITYEDRYTNGTDEERAVIAERYTEMHRIYRKYNLLIFEDYVNQEYAPEVLDLETNPFDSWATLWAN